jgi:cystathionine beta-lyase/cystathionine gamma-synthase
MPQDVRNTAGIEEGLVRLSIGLENPKDLLADLQEALKA